MPTIYTIGYQPIELVSRHYALKDIMNEVMTLGIQTNNVKADVINFLKKFQLQEGDKFLLNIPRNKSLIPYVWAELNSQNSMQNLIVYDPPYAGSTAELGKILRSIHMQVGGKPGQRGYIDAINSLRDLLNHNKENMSQSDYYISLMLLSDANGGNVEPFLNHLMNFKTKVPITAQKKAIYFGDPIKPGYIQYLNSIGIHVVSFMPYEYFTLPCDTLDSYYADNGLFQSPLYTLIELRRLLSLYMPDMVIMNPGGIYLTEDEAEFYKYKLAGDVRVEIIPGMYSGIQLTV